MTMCMPKFLEDKSWYTETYDEEGYVTYELTDQAPPEAVESYEQYMAMMAEEGVDY